jgi:hypothetical protein
MMAVPSSVTCMVGGLCPVTAMYVIGQIAMIAGKDILTRPTVRLFSVGECEFSRETPSNRNFYQA